jgi:hypothetical protein
MTLMHAGDDGGGFHHCVHCGATAAGPCGRCGRPCCGDCVVLTEGGAHVWAICKTCDAAGGRQLRSGWGLVVGWLLLPILGLAVALVVLAWLFGRL